MSVNLPFSDDETSLEKLLTIMAALRHPQTGCPWDLEQDFSTISPYTVEEAYEVADAIARRDYNDLLSELGDLLFQVVFHSQLASEQGLFSFSDVTDAITDKMIRRHPHVFGDEKQRSSSEQTVAWEELKAKERESRGSQAGEEDISALDGVANTLPAMIRAQKLQKRAARVGFDWPGAEDVFAKLEEEALELRHAIANKDLRNIEEEIGDLLFVCVNLARKVGTDAETSLKHANDKFVNRFKAMETESQKRNAIFSKLSLQTQEELWQFVKKQERS